MTVTEPHRHAPADLRARLAELGTVAAGLGRWWAGAAQRSDGIVKFLRGHLARAEEAAIVKADRVEIVGGIDWSAGTVAAVTAGPATAKQAEQLRAQLYGLGAILLLHFNTQEEMPLPVLDIHLTDEHAQQIADTVAVAHPHARGDA
jgi:hypothetical protein